MISNSCALSPKTRDLRVVLLGGYGGGNLGDEAICEAIVANIRHFYPTAAISVFTYDPQLSLQVLSDVDWLEYKYYPFQLRYTISHNPWKTREIRRTIEQADVILVGGGGLFYESKFSYFYISHLVTWFNRLVYLKARNKKYWLYGISLSRLRTRLGRKLIAPILQWAQEIWVRDSLSLRLCQEYSGREARLTPDLVLAYNCSSTETEVHRDQRRIIIAPRPLHSTDPDQGLAKWVYIISALFRHLPDHRIILIPFDPRMDSQFCESINRYVEQRCQVIRPSRYDIGEITQIFAQAGVVIAMPLHAAVFAVRAGTPVLGMFYDDKVRAFFRDLGLGDCCLDWHAIPPPKLVREILSRVQSPGFLANATGGHPFSMPNWTSPQDALGQILECCGTLSDARKPWQNCR